MTIRTYLATPEQRKEKPRKYVFGANFSDHMFTQEYSSANGWHDAKISPYHPITLDPATSVFHYAQEIFEGLKAYRRPDGMINLFRPEENAARFTRSATRMAMQPVDEALHVEAIRALVALENDWVPHEEGASYYIRPAMIATRPTIGMAPSDSYLHFIIGGPAGAYYASGFNPIAVKISDKYRRSVVGGVGEAKTGGNYAASIYVATEAAKEGYEQVLWLDAIHGRNVEEVGAMNICFVYEGSKIVTPALSGSILPGITRKSVLELSASLGYEMSEETVDVEQMLADIESGKITEVFGCGTAAVISPVGRFGYKGKDYVVNNNQTGVVAQRIYDQLTGIQYGTIEDTFGWTQVVDV
jgi:branched-chain amino acid aminotransferase